MKPRSLVFAAVFASTPFVVAACHLGHELPTEVGYSHAPPSTSSRDGDVAQAPRDQIARAIEDISALSFRRDLTALSVWRSHQANPRGLGTVARYIEAELGKTPFVITEQSVVFEGVRAVNIVAERAGSDPSRVVLLTAHYDAVVGTAGADDDASGVAGVLGAARAIAKVDTEATIRLVFFSFEEPGLIGSTQYVKSLSKDDKDKIVGVFDLEMIGYTDHKPDGQKYPPGLQLLAGDRKLPTVGEFIGVVGAPADAPMLDAADKARSYVRDLHVEILRVPRPMAILAPDLLRSDHAPFWLANIPAALVGDTANFRNPNYHRATDMPETLDLLFASRVTQWSAAAAMVLAVQKETAPAPAASSAPSP